MLIGAGIGVGVVSNSHARFSQVEALLFIGSSAACGIPQLFLIFLKCLWELQEIRDVNLYRTPYRAIFIPESDDLFHPRV